MKEIGSARLRSETEFLRRQNNLTLSRQKKIRSIQVRGFHLFGTFLIVGLLSFFSYRAGAFLLSWEKLNVKSYKLINVPEYRRNAIKVILRQHQGNILALNLKDIQKKLVAFNEVKNVTLSRHLPDRVEILFELRTPVFQLISKNGIYLFDAEGVYLTRISESDSRYIRIRHLKKANIEKMIPFMGGLLEMKDRIEYVGYREPYGLLLKLKNLSEILYPGEGGVKEKVNQYLRIREGLRLQRRGLSYVDLRFRNRIYFACNEEVVHSDEK